MSKLSDIPNRMTHGFNVVVRGPNVRPAFVIEDIKKLLVGIVPTVQVVQILSANSASIQYLVDDMRFNFVDVLILWGNIREIPYNIMIDMLDRGRTIVVTNENTVHPAICNRSDVITL